MNVEWLYYLPAPLRRALYWGLQRAIGSRIGAAWREFQAWQSLSAESLAARVEASLSRTLAGAVADCSYYRQLAPPRCPEETAGDWLRRFPVLTRDIVRDHFAALVADRLRPEITSPQSVSPRRYDWVVVKTGGTTGQPTAVVHDAWGRDMGRAARLFSARQCGHPLGTRYFRLWGSEQDLLRTQTRLPLRVQRSLLGEVPMNAFRSKEADLRHHHATLLAQPEITSLMAYIDAAAILALFIQEQHLPPPRLKTIMACAGMVTPEWRRLLQETFQAEVFDKYGSRECGDMACECRQHQGLHVYSPNVFLEVVDEQNRPCPPGQTGRVLVTLLNNHSFPLIRYENGDLAQWAAPGICPCGLAWPRLQGLEGRADDVLMTEEGTLITSVVVRHFVGVSLNRQLLREWQLEQVAPKQFIFRYVPLQTEGLAANLAQLQDGFRAVLGQGVTIGLESVTAIPLASSGKRRWIINSVKKASNRAGRPATANRRE